MLLAQLKLELDLVDLRIDEADAVIKKTARENEACQRLASLWQLPHPGGEIRARVSPNNARPQSDGRRVTFPKQPGRKRGSNGYLPSASGYGHEVSTGSEY
jgi:hypothetical protein